MKSIFKLLVLFLTISSCATASYIIPFEKNIYINGYVFQTISSTGISAALVHTKNEEVVLITTTKEYYFYDGMKVRGFYDRYSNFTYTNKYNDEITVPVYIKKHELNNCSSTQKTKLYANNANFYNKI